jgi:hypothetical protein
MAASKQQVMFGAAASRPQTTWASLLARDQWVRLHAVLDTLGFQEWQGIGHNRGVITNCNTLKPAVLVGDTGFEPATSSVSGKRATTAPIAQSVVLEVETGFEPVYAALQAAASPLGHSTTY